jgi:hypothetical protein
MNKSEFIQGIEISCYNFYYCLSGKLKNEPDIHLLLLL